MSQLNQFAKASQPLTELPKQQWPILGYQQRSKLTTTTA